MVIVFVRWLVLFVWFLTRDLPVASRTCRTYILEVLQSEPPRFAPYLFWIKTHLCFTIRLTIVITSVHTVMQIIVSNTKDDLRPHWPPPLCNCRRHVGAAVTADIAAVLSPPLLPSPLPLPLPRLPLSPPPPALFPLLLLPLFGWLLSALLLPLLHPPLHALTLAAVGCQCHCHCHCSQKPPPPAHSTANAWCSKYYI